MFARTVTFNVFANRIREFRVPVTDTLVFISTVGL